MKYTLRTDFSEVKSVFGFRVRLGNPDLDFENLNTDFPIERTLKVPNVKIAQSLQFDLNAIKFNCTDNFCQIVNFKIAQI